MKRSLLSLAIGASLVSPAIRAAVVDDTEAAAALQNNAHIETVVVTSTLNKSLEETALPVTVVSGDELQQRAAGSIGATLDSSPGLANSSFGPGVGQPVIRGQSGARVQVLENGTSSADASGASADHAVTVESMLAESVEVLRGPSTLLYGGGAIGGVINVIDNRIPRVMPDQLKGAIEYRHDSVDDAAATVMKFDGGAGPLAWHLDGVYRDWSDVDIPGLAFNKKTTDTTFSSDGHIANTDGRNHTVTGGASWIFDDGYLGFSVSDMKNHYGIPLDPDAQGDTRAGVHIDMDQQRYDMAGEWRELGDAIDTLRWHLTYSDYQHQEIGNTGDIGTTFTNQTWENRVELAHREMAGWRGVVGVQLKRSDFAARGEESFIPQSINNGTGLFVVEDYQLDSWLYEIGLRYDRDVIDPADNFKRETFNNLSGSASALWTLDERWSLGLALSRSQRAPTVEELFSNTANSAGNYVAHDATHAIEVGSTDLNAETSRNIDLTVNYKAAWLSGYVTAYHNDFSDFIALTNTGQEQAGVPIMNYLQRGARFDGLEFDLNFPLASAGWGALNLDVYGDRIRGEFNGGSSTGAVTSEDNDVPHLPPFRIGTRLNFQADAFAAYAGVLHAAAQNRAGQFETDTDGYNRVDAGISYTLKSDDTLQTLLFLRGTNLTNVEIRNSVSLLKDVAPEPGRSLEAGVRLSF